MRVSCVEYIVDALLVGYNVWLEAFDIRRSLSGAIPKHHRIPEIRWEVHFTCMDDGKLALEAKFTPRPTKGAYRLRNTSSHSNGGSSLDMRCHRNCPRVCGAACKYASGIVSANANSQSLVDQTTQLSDVLNSVHVSFNHPLVRQRVNAIQDNESRNGFEGRYWKSARELMEHCQVTLSRLFRV